MSFTRTAMWAIPFSGGTDAGVTGTGAAAGGISWPLAGIAIPRTAATTTIHISIDKLESRERIITSPPAHAPIKFIQLKDSRRLRRGMPNSPASRDSHLQHFFLCRRPQNREFLRQPFRCTCHPIAGGLAPQRGINDGLNDVT